MVKLKRMKKIWCFLIFLFGFSLYALRSALPVKAQECPPDDGSPYCVEFRQLQTWLDALGPAQEKNRAELANYRKQLSSIQTKLTVLDKNLKATEKEIHQREIDLGVQEELLSARIRDMYKRNREFSYLTILFSSRSIEDFSHGLALRTVAAKEDWQIITATSDKILSLKKDKETLKKNQESLAALQVQANKQADFLAGEVEKTESFFAQVRKRQAELLALKEGGFSTSVGDVPPADDPASRPDYNPGFSPAFAAFSFGAPHRKGMSQYGAYGRAKSGQSAEEILRAYYGGVELKKDYSTGINIRVQGYGTVDIETYTKRIYEMPGSWGDSGGFEALKAQAVAARSYALAYTNNGAGSICATEKCQVYKPANKGGKWDEAVNATRGWVLVAGGKPFSAWYASTAGGYTFSYSSNGHSTPGLWDTKSGRGGWTNEAYEKIAGSPWFYKAWYRTRENATYGRSHPWLNEEEFSDILNALLIYKGNKGDEVHLSPIDRNIPETWSVAKVKEEAAKYDGPITSVSEVSVNYSPDGYTNQVRVTANGKERVFSGEEFKHIFNLRAPGAIALKSSLFNIMKK